MRPVSPHFLDLGRYQGDVLFRILKWFSEYSRSSNHLPYLENGYVSHLKPENLYVGTKEESSPYLDGIQRSGGQGCEAEWILNNNHPRNWARARYCHSDNVVLKEG
jgi:hypothetical protein